MTELTCARFSEELAAKVSVPGGGGAAALCGAFGVALCSMAANFTVGKKKFLEYDADLKRILADGEIYRAKLISLVEEDAKAFEPLSKAYGIPKEQEGRDQILEEATMAALMPPLEMMEVVAKSVDLMEEMLTKGSKLMISDVGCAAYLAQASMQSASLNVLINTKFLKNRKKASEVNERVDYLLKTYVPKASQIAEEVHQQLLN